MAKRRETTKAAVLASVRRWKQVNAHERDELRHATLDTKLRQLAALMFSCDVLGLTDNLAAKGENPRERWRALRRAYGR